MSKDVRQFALVTTPPLTAKNAASAVRRAVRSIDAASGVKIVQSTLNTDPSRTYVAVTSTEPLSRILDVIGKAQGIAAARPVLKTPSFRATLIT
jgi:hypothetical protein